MSHFSLLVADDNALSLQFLAAAFAQLGADVTCAADGGQAVALAGKRAFDLLVLDLNMPVQDGCAVLEAIRAGAGPSRQAPALATSAEVDAEHAAALAAHGFAQVLAKPLTIEILREALEHHLPQARLCTTIPCELDDARALHAVAGDASILAALRALFVTELSELPVELASLATQRDREGLRARLHRLAASAGFCGTPSLTAAIARLRIELEHDVWPGAAVEAFLDHCHRVHDVLRAAAAR